MSLTVDPVMSPGRPASPFRPAVLRPLPEAGEDAWRIDRLVAAATSLDATRAAGALLASAVWHGALLDQRCWDAWLDRAPGEHLGALAWIDLPRAEDEDAGDGNRAAPNRWFTDPTTRLLLDRWTERPAGIDGGVPPATDCLRVFLDTDEQGVARFAEQAEWRWRLRLPGVLMQKALGRTEDRSLRPEAWSRLLHAAPVPAPAPAPARPKPASGSEKSDKPVRIPIKSLEELLSRRSLKERAQLDKGRTRRQQHNDVVRKVKKLDVPDDPAAALLYEYARALLSARLTADGKGTYAPATVSKYLAALRKHVFEAILAGPLDPSSPTDLWHRYEAAAGRLSGGKRHELLNAVGAFDRFAQRFRPDLALPDTDRLATLREWGRTGGVVNIVSGSDYERAHAALAPLRSFEGRQARLCLVLGYRAGLRDREVRAVATDDLLFTDDGSHCDLLIRNKWYAATKTRTSCRMLPLHVLLEPDELADLRAWAIERRGSTPPSRSIRLFSTRDRPAHAMPSGFLGQRVAPALRAATGDEGITFGSLRHSFVSHLIATLLLPDDGAGPSLPRGWKASDVSLARKRRLTPSLVGDGRLGQAMLHAVSLLAGHLSTDTTLRDYTHTLDWVLGAHVGRPANQPGLSMAQAAALAGMSEAAVRKLVQRLPSPAPDIGEVAAGGVPAPVRPRRGRGRGSATAPPSAYPDQLLARAARRRPDRTTLPPPARQHAAGKSPDSGQVEVLPWRELLACVKEGAASHYRPDVAARFGVRWEALNRWIAAREFLLWPRPLDRAERWKAWLVALERGSGLTPLPKQMSSRAVRDRSRGGPAIERWERNFPPTPTPREADLIDWLWERTFRARPEVIARGAAIFATRYDAHDNAVLACDWAEACDFQLLLEALGIGNVARKHRPGRGRARRAIAAVGARRPGGVSEDDGVAFFLARTSDGSSPGARRSGLRRALVLLAILYLETELTSGLTGRPWPVLRRGTTTLPQADA